MVATLKERVRERLEQLGRNPFEAARVGGLERSFVNDILRGQKNSVQGSNLKKLALALDWTVNDIVGEAGVSLEENEPPPLYSGQLKDNDSIQVEVGVLRSLIAEALVAEGVQQDEAEAYADGVLGSLAARPAGSVVIRLGAPDRNGPGSTAPAPDGPS